MFVSQLPFYLPYIYIFIYYIQHKTVDFKVFDLKPFESNAPFYDYRYLRIFTHGLFKVIGKKTWCKK